jgi:hypothetical protein
MGERHNKHVIAEYDTIDAYLAAAEKVEDPRSNFLDRSNWQISKRGNYWRMWRGVTLTIFQRQSDYHWCVADDEGPRFSDRGYPTVRGAVRALGRELDVLDDE